MDVVFGRVDKFLRKLMGKWDILSFSDDVPSNHFILFKNTPYYRDLYLQISDYASLFEYKDHLALDDFAFLPVLRKQPRAWFQELHATPHICMKPWMDGTLNFPTRWCWNQGQLTNNLDIGFEFMYFHFMVWKGGYRDCYCRIPNWERLQDSELRVKPEQEAFAITSKGIQSTKPRAVKQLRRAGLGANPKYSLRRRIRIKKLKWL